MPILRLHDGGRHTAEKSKLNRQLHDIFLDIVDFEE
jgi:hypothetical protein